MAKGALRVAIEDFFETFDFGKILSGWSKKVVEDFEEETMVVYEKLINDLGVATYLPDNLTPSHIRQKYMTNQGGIVLIIAGIVGIMSSIVIGLLTVFVKPITYKLNTLVRPNRPSPGDIAQMVRIKPDWYESIIKWVSEQGYPEQYVDLLVELTRKYLSPLDYIDAFRRGEIDSDTLYKTLYQDGYSPSDIQRLLKITEIIPSVNDLIRMAVREAFSPDIVQKFHYDEAFPQGVLEYTRKQGLPDDWVKRYWYSHWELPSPQLGYEMLHRLRPNRTNNPFTIDDMDLLLRVSDYAPYFRDKMIEISYNPVTRVDIRRMYKIGVIDEHEVKERYMDLGYTEHDAELLTQFTIKYETESGENIKEKIKELSLGAANSMYKKGILNEIEYRNRVKALGYPDDVIDLYVELNNLEIRNDIQEDYRNEYIKNMISDIRKAYANRMIDKEDAVSALTQIGVPQDHINYIILAEDYQADLLDLNDTLSLLTDSYLSGAISRETLISEIGKLGLGGAQQQKVINHIELQMRYRKRRLTESQYRNAVENGIISVEDYKQALVGLGYTDKDIDILVKLYNLEEVQ